MIDRAIFEGRVDTVLIVAMIILIEIVKQCLSAGKIKPPVWVWKLSVVVLGLVAAILAADFAAVTARDVIISMLLYAGCATVVYQTIRIPIKAIKEKGDKA